MAWTKVEHGLADKPEVIAMAAELAVSDRDLIVGKLIKLWEWFDKNTTDGNARGVTPAFIDSHVAIDGFATALESVGWLSIRNGSITQPNFDRHNSKSAKARALGSERVKRSRNGASVTSSLPEKRREEKSIPPLSPDGERERLLILVAGRNVHDAQPAVDGALARGCLPSQIEGASRRAEGKALLTILNAMRPPSAAEIARKAIGSKEDQRARIISANAAAGISREQTNRELISAGLDGVAIT